MNAYKIIATNSWYFKTLVVGASHVLAETDLSIFPDEWIDKRPYERADETAEALRRAIPSYPFDVVRSGSAAGNSAYIKTPMGDIRISDHGSHPKAGVLWQGPEEEMSPRKFVALVADRMDKTINRLLDGPPPNKFGSPRPSWMRADEWKAFYAQQQGDRTASPPRHTSQTH